MRVEESDAIEFTSFKSKNEKLKTASPTRREYANRPDSQQQ